jgi:hypothetical protein
MLLSTLGGSPTSRCSTNLMACLSFRLHPNDALIVQLAAQSSSITTSMGNSRTRHGSDAQNGLFPRLGHYHPRP